MKNSKTLKPICMIPARGGSKGVPGKNTKLFLGKPLIAHAIRSAIKSKDFQSVIVTTDDKKIATIAKSYGAKVPFLRPKTLSRDSTGMDEVILHTIKKLLSMNYEFDILVNRDCTAPFVRNADVRGSIQLLKRTRCHAVVAAYKTHLNPYFNMMEFNKKKFLEVSKKMKHSVVSRQTSPPVFQLTSFQAIDVTQFLKNKKMYTSKVLPYEIKAENGLMIDTQYEFKIAQCLGETYFQKMFSL